MVHVRFQIFSGVKYFSWNVSDGYKTQTFDHQLYPASHSVNLMNLFNWTLNLCKCSYFYFKSWNILLRRAQHPTSPVPAHLICITIHDVTGVQCGAEDLSLSLSLTWCIIILPRSVCHIPPLTALLKLSQYFQLWLITCPDLQISDMAASTHWTDHLNLKWLVCIL